MKKNPKLNKRNDRSNAMSTTNLGKTKNDDGSTPVKARTHLNPDEILNELAKDTLKEHLQNLVKRF
jgi:hypothetical protein